MDWGDVSFLLMGFLVEQQVYLTPGIRCRVKRTLPAHGSDISFFSPFFLRNFSELNLFFSSLALPQEHCQFKSWEISHLISWRFLGFKGPRFCWVMVTRS